MEHYQKIDKIGEGTYGKVYKALDRRNGQYVALKKTRHVTHAMHVLREYVCDSENGQWAFIRMDIMHGRTRVYTYIHMRAMTAILTLCVHR